MVIHCSLLPVKEFPVPFNTVRDIALASISTVSADGVAGWKRELGELATSLGNN